MHRIFLAIVALCGSVAVSAADSVHALRLAAPALCRQLQELGWQAPADIAKLQGEPAAAEINVPGVMYLCNLEQVLEGEGPGRPPELQALLTDAGDEPSLIFSANLWCESDRTIALDSLAKRIDPLLKQAALSLPSDVVAAVRAGRAADVTFQDITFTATPIDVDAEACAKVGPGGLGSVLFKIELSIKPVGY